MYIDLYVSFGNDSSVTLDQYCLEVQTKKKRNSQYDRVKQKRKKKKNTKKQNKKQKNKKEPFFI